MDDTHSDSYLGSCPTPMVEFFSQKSYWLNAPNNFRKKPPIIDA